MEERKEILVLFVGEGDFSFSANYIIKSRYYNEKIYASCLSDDVLTERQQRNIEVIEQNGGFVYTDVDATCLESHPEIKKLQFQKIVFNFPHIPGKMNIRKNRQLVEQFFLSARKILLDCGTIWVTLCQGQGGTEIEKVKRKWCDTWQIVGLAASASLILYRVKSFDAKAFDTYRCTGYRGLQKPFNTKGALTHIFKYGPPVHIKNKNVKNYLDIDLYLQDCETLYRNISRNLCWPTFKVLSILNDITMKNFKSVHQRTINNLLTCRNFSLMNSNTSFMEEFCENCLGNLFYNFLKKKTSGLTFIICSICCIKIIDIGKNPFYHLLSYFSNDAEYLLTSLPTVLKNLKQEYNLKKINTELTIQNDYLNKKKIQALIHNIDPSVREEYTVKCILNICAQYSFSQENELIYYSNIDFLLNNTSCKMSAQSSLKIGSVLQFDYDFKKYTCILFNLNTLAYLKYHITDYRSLFSENSFYSTHLIWGYPIKIYRSFSLYAPTYVHDISFYVEQDFCENDFFLVIKNTIGYFIKSVTLVDSYFDPKLNKHSRCYRLCYQSCHQVLTKEKASLIHTDLVRKSLANSLNIILR